MKLMFVKHFKSLLYAATGLIFVTAGCSKVDDLYKTPAGDSSALIPNTTIPANFNWATTKAVSVNVAVLDEYEGKYFYKVEIFDREPHAAGANLLAAGLAKKGQDYTTQLTIPTGLTVVYVQQTTPTGSVSYTMLAVNGATTVSTKAAAGSVSQVGNSAMAMASGTAKANIATAAAAPTAPAVPANAYALEGSNDLDWNTTNTNKILVVKKGTTFTGNVAFNSGIEGVVVYVEGTWAPRSNDITVGSKNTLIVLAEGQLKAKTLSLPSSNIVFTNYGKTAVAVLSANNTATISNHGTLTVEGTFNVPANTAVSNTGTLTAKDMTINSSGTLMNSGSLTLKGTMEVPANALFVNSGTAVVPKLTGNSTTGTVTNEGTLFVEDADLTNMIFNVNCLTTVVKMKVDGLKVNIATGARLDITNLHSGGGIYTLQKEAILDVKEQAEFTTQKSTIKGDGTSYALARIKALKLGGALSVSYEGNLEVAVTNHPTNPQYNPVYSSGPSVRIVDYGKVTAAITGTACNAGGFNATPVPPVDQTIPPVVLGTYSYAFEDNWPAKGDYDMNDLVVDVQIVKYQNKENKVEKIVLKNKIRSVGASKRLALAIQLDNVLANAVKSVSYSKADVIGKVLPLTGTGVENGQKYAVVTVVDDAHAAFGQSNTAFIFTHDNSKQPLETEISITFNTPLANFSYADLNPFIVNYAQQTGGRNEVHLVGYKGTDKINVNLIAREQLAAGVLSTNDPFKTKGNEPFALSLPLSFQYPYEGRAINKVYPEFNDWVASGGATHQNWYDKYTK